MSIENTENTEENSELKTEPVSLRVKIKTTDGTTFRGKINIMSETVPVDRLSDFFIKGEYPFVVLYAVTNQGASRVIIINKSQIVWVTPDDY